MSSIAVVSNHINEMNDGAQSSQSSTTTNKSSPARNLSAGTGSVATPTPANSFWPHSTPVTSSTATTNNNNNSVLVSKVIGNLSFDTNSQSQQSPRRPHSSSVSGAIDHESSLLDNWSFSSSGLGGRTTQDSGVMGSLNKSWGTHDLISKMSRGMNSASRFDDSGFVDHHSQSSNQQNDNSNNKQQQQQQQQQQPYLSVPSNLTGSGSGGGSGFNPMMEALRSQSMASSMMNQQSSSKAASAHHDTSSDFFSSLNLEPSDHPTPYGGHKKTSSKLLAENQHEVEGGLNSLADRLFNLDALGNCEVPLNDSANIGKFNMAVGSNLGAQTTGQQRLISQGLQTNVPPSLNMHKWQHQAAGGGLGSSSKSSVNPNGSATFPSNTWIQQQQQPHSASLSSSRLTPGSRRSQVPSMPTPPSSIDARQAAISALLSNPQAYGNIPPNVLAAALSSRYRSTSPVTSEEQIRKALLSQLLMQQHQQQQQQQQQQQHSHHQHQSQSQQQAHLFPFDGSRSSGLTSSRDHSSLLANNSGHFGGGHQHHPSSTASEQLLWHGAGASGASSNGRYLLGTSTASAGHHHSTLSPHLDQSSGAGVNASVSNSSGGNANPQSSLPTTDDPMVKKQICEVRANEHKSKARHSESYPPGGHSPQFVRWVGRRQEPVNMQGGVSSKVFLGGLPWDIAEDELLETFASFGAVSIEWPNKDHVEKAHGKGYAYAVFADSKSVVNLLNRCQKERAKDNENICEFFFGFSRRHNKTMQIIPWFTSDNEWSIDGRTSPSSANAPASASSSPQPAGASSSGGARLTAFVGALHGQMTANMLRIIFEDKFGKVVSVYLDTDKHKYPIGSGRVVFAEAKAFRQAIEAGFVDVQTQHIFKRIQIDPYLEEQSCWMCNGARSGDYFCRSFECFRYFCPECFYDFHASIELNRNSVVTGHVPIARSTASTRSSGGNPTTAACSSAQVPKQGPVTGANSVGPARASSPNFNNLLSHRHYLHMQMVGGGNNGGSSNTSNNSANVSTNQVAAGGLNLGPDWLPVDSR